MREVVLLRLALLALALCVPLLGGCLDTSSGDDAEGPKIIAGDWPMERPSSSRFEPGKRLSVLVQNVDIPLTDIVLYVNDVALLSPRVRVVEEGDDPDSNADDVIELSTFLPLAQAREYLIGFGSENARRTGQLPITIFVPNRRMPRAEAALRLEAGVAALTETVGAVWLDEDPAYRQFLQQTAGSDGIAALGDLTTAGKSIAALAREQYDALSDEDERALQALLFNTELTRFFREIEQPVSAKVIGDLGTTQQPLLTLADRLKHPVHRVFYTLDFMAMGLHVAGDALDVINLAAALTGGGGLTVSAPVTVAFGLMKFAIDSFIPTDLFELEAHDQKRLYDNRRAKWVYWGTFRPQSGLSNIAGATLEAGLSALLQGLIEKGALGDRVALLWKQLNKTSKAPEQLLKEISDNLLNMLQKIGSVAAGKGIDNALQKLAGSTDALHEAKLQVNMAAYTLTAGDLMSLIPVFGLALKSTTWIIDFEISEPIEADASSAPDFMKDVTAGLYYADDEIGVSGPAAFPAGVKEGPLTLISNAYRWQQKPLLMVLNRPGYESVSITHGLVVEDGDVFTQRDDTLITTATPSGELVITKGSSKERPVQVTLANIFIQMSQAPTVSLLVNGVAQIDSLELPQSGKPTPPITLMLAPGENQLTLVGVASSAGVNGCATTLTFPDAINTMPEKQIYIAAGEQQTFRVFTPPAVE